MAPRKRVFCRGVPEVLELLLIAAIVLLVFGTGKLRSAGSSLGAAVKSFRKSVVHAGAAERRPGRVKSERPDAEFPEVATRQGRGPDGA